LGSPVGATCEISRPEERREGGLLRKWDSYLFYVVPGRRVGGKDFFVEFFAYRLAVLRAKEKVICLLSPSGAIYQ